jgi:hypothetical protein
MTFSISYAPTLTVYFGAVGEFAQMPYAFVSIIPHIPSAVKFLGIIFFGGAV